jgi:hypothetical protein
MYDHRRAMRAKPANYFSMNARSAMLTESFQSRQPSAVRFPANNMDSFPEERLNSMGKPGFLDFTNFMEHDSSCSNFSSAYSSQELSPSNMYRGTSGVQPELLSQALRQAGFQLQHQAPQLGAAAMLDMDATLADGSGLDHMSDTHSASRRARIRVEHMTEEELRHRHESRYDIDLSH